MISRRSHEVARLWEQALLGSPRVDCRIKDWHPGHAAADAWAAGKCAAIGGWWTCCSRTLWFQKDICRSDSPWNLELGSNLRSDIAFFEALAQLALLWLRVAEEDIARGRILTQECDNEAVNVMTRQLLVLPEKGLSTTVPLCYALQALAYWERSFQVKTNFSYIPGDQNILADALSRWKAKWRLLTELKDVDQR